jgi:hypothetical protein
MTINEAIRNSIRGGYDCPTRSEEGAFLEVIFLDPSFWQSLGKALGWIDAEYPNGSIMCNSEKCDSRYCEYAGYRNPVDQWHRFIDHLAEGKTAESFFEALL